MQPHSPHAPTYAHVCAALQLTVLDCGVGGEARHDTSQHTCHPAGDQSVALASKAVQARGACGRWLHSTLTNWVLATTYVAVMLVSRRVEDAVVVKLLAKAAALGCSSASACSNGGQ
jgi:hypothetical protein